MTQLDLPTAPPEPGKPLTLEQRWQAFHEANPQVFARLLELARGKLARGARFISAKALYEELRAEITKREIEYGYKPEYKLNNNHVAFIARLLVETEPRLVGVIETRKRTAK